MGRTSVSYLETKHIQYTARNVSSTSNTQFSACDHMHACGHAHTDTPTSRNASVRALSQRVKFTGGTHGEKTRVPEPNSKPRYRLTKSPSFLLQNKTVALLCILTIQRAYTQQFLSSRWRLFSMPNSFGAKLVMQDNHPKHCKYLPYKPAREVHWLQERGPSGTNHCHKFPPAVTGIRSCL